MSTSLLTTTNLIGDKKTRAMAQWAEQRGFKTRIVERAFPGGLRIAAYEPMVLLGGVDNADARAAYEDAGFDWIVEAGLGAGPVEYLTMRLHTFPASTTARLRWGGVSVVHDTIAITTEAYNKLAKAGMNECGLVQLASRTVGASFVGTVAASLSVPGPIRSVAQSLICRSPQLVSVPKYSECSVTICASR